MKNYVLLIVAAAFIGKEHEFINLAGFALDFDGHPGIFLSSQELTGQGSLLVQPKVKNFSLAVSKGVVRGSQAIFANDCADKVAAHAAGTKCTAVYCIVLRLIFNYGRHRYKVAILGRNAPDKLSAIS